MYMYMYIHVHVCIIDYTRYCICIIYCDVIPAVGGRGQPKPAKLKRMAKLSKQEVCACACGGHATAMVTRDGKLYMFGSLEEDLVDKASGEWARLPELGLLS